MEVFGSVSNEAFTPNGVTWEFQSNSHGWQDINTLDMNRLCSPGEPIPGPPVTVEHATYLGCFENENSREFCCGPKNYGYEP
jgi:hypothetical protein